MKRTILLAITICLFTAANAQKTKVAPAQKNIKTFELSETTAKDLPKGVSYLNGIITLKSGYTFEQLPNNRGVRLVNAKGVSTGSFVCRCGGMVGGMVTCKPGYDGTSLTCGGGACCKMTVTINPSAISDMQMKQN